MGANVGRNGRTSSKVVVVTGASAGVGRAVAREFAKRGYDVGLVARGAARLDDAVRELTALGVRAHAVPADVADAEALEAAAETFERELGPIDVWVNNAMASIFSPFVKVTHEEFRRVTEVTYLGSVNGTRSALRRMRARDRGVIVQVGSALAYRGIPLQSAYCGAKHAINGFLDSIRCELLHDRSKVKVTQVHLPAVNTPQFEWVRSRLPSRAQPVPPIFAPEVAARAIVWAADHPKREHWLGMSTTQAIFGQRVAAPLLDRYLAYKGYQGQMTGEPEDPSRRDNLFEPVPGDFAASGRFGERSKRRSLQAALARNKGFVVAALASAGLASLSAIRFVR